MRNVFPSCEMHDVKYEKCVISELLSFALVGLLKVLALILCHPTRPG
jgi:hypothetical protein